MTDFLHLEDVYKSYGSKRVLDRFVEVTADP